MLYKSAISAVEQRKKDVNESTNILKDSLIKNLVLGELHPSLQNKQANYEARVTSRVM